MAKNVITEKFESKHAQINLAAAEKFLNFLNPKTRNLFFRTYAENKSEPLNLNQKLNGDFAELKKTLINQNLCGASVCVVVNEGGHTDKEITKIKFVFVDTDGAPIEPILSALNPHIVIETSPGNFHVYWQVKNFKIENFKPFQKAIANKFSTDISINNPSRIMRVPGFLHQKHTPFCVRIIELNNSLPPYTAQDLQNAFGVNLYSNHPTPTEQTMDPAQQNRVQPPLDEIEKMLCYMEPFESYDRWSKVGFLLADYYGEDARSLYVRWSSGQLWDKEKNAS